ncbi:MAG: hypothetical protein WC413_01480 [Candidatus Nanoarchaeia archaeon]
MKMTYNLLEEIQKEIRNAKKKGGRDVYAISSLLSLEKELKQKSNLLEKFKKSAIYKDRVLKSLNFFSKTVKKWNKEVSKKGNKAFSDRSEKQWYLDTKRDFKLLQKEAKRLKL